MTRRGPRARRCNLSNNLRWGGAAAWAGVAVLAADFPAAEEADFQAVAADRIQVEVVQVETVETDTREARATAGMDRKPAR